MAISTVPHVSLAVGASKFQAVVHSTVLSATHVIVGLVVSTTVTFWLHSTKLPHSSVARHFRVVSKVFPQWPAVFVVVLTIVKVTSPQVSDANGGSKVHAFVHS